MKKTPSPMPLKNHNEEAIQELIREKEESNEPGQDYINIKEKQCHVEKTRLADHIVRKYISDLDAVAVDAGSSLQLIVERMMKTKHYLSILTNNMTAFWRDSRRREVQRNGNEFILTGGKYVALFDALLGNETLTSFELFHPTVVVIGVSGLIPRKGFFCHGNDEKKVKELLFSKRDCTIIIPADHSKLGKPDAYLFGGTGDFKRLSGTRRIVVTVPPAAQDSEGSRGDVEIRSQSPYAEQVAALKNEGIEVDEVPLLNGVR